MNLTENQTLITNATTYEPPTQKKIAEDPKEVLYEDKYVILTREAITIKLYYFPFGSKKIYYQDITRVQNSTTMGLKWYELKEWGMGVSNIWWSFAWNERSQIGAFDSGNNLVITQEGSSYLKGFSTKAPSKVYDIINKQRTG